MGPIVASVDATISVPSDGINEQRRLNILAEVGVRGGMVRGWSGKAWPTFLNDAYYVVAQVGPYNLQMLRILGTADKRGDPQAITKIMAEQSVTYTVATPSEYETWFRYASEQLATCKS